jgi:hypothetical protein
MTFSSGKQMFLQPAPLTKSLCARGNYRNFLVITKIAEKDFPLLRREDMGNSGDLVLGGNESVETV